ncbi:response regulator transcription factor [Halomonas organivorans]|uniref:DNA-binding CsgD family transcriptional regulator n=1 Tax=Halomonas organivorans TaxID=257772 RepID=A0A7W5C0P6_9GAMM|nr:LuxR C-terminal-related transcriptional regulator [Halomonas organivorans]MBB3142223.1 DNA-binding CsgD family transcriptional regulator [Halomonas organivorans]
MDHAPQHIEFAGFRCRIGGRGSSWPTAKQAMVLAGLAAGMTQKEIARERGISPATVKSTAEAIYYRLNATRAADAIVKGLRRTWIAPIVILLMCADLHGQSLRARMPVRTRQQTTVTARAASGGRGPDLGELIA